MQRIFLLMICLNGLAQDLYDKTHTTAFAKYLLNSGQFLTAQKEYERLVFLSPGNDTIQADLLRAYRMNSDFSAGLQRATDLYLPKLMPAKISLEYGKLLIGNGQLADAEQAWTQNTLIDSTDRVFLKTTSLVLQDQFTAAHALVSGFKDTHSKLAELGFFLDQATADKYKNPALAGFMSALMPSSGRFYAKDKKDGLISLIFMATNAIQSYRGFNKTGIKSVRGWVYGGLGFGFYLGNIYGSVQSAKQYNKRKKHGYKEAILGIFNTYY